MARNRDLFPLPCLYVEKLERPQSVSRSVKRRVHRRIHLQRRVNLAVSSLNSFFLGFDNPFVQHVNDLEKLPQGQRETLKFILKRVASAGPPPPNASCAGAIHALRVAGSPYGGLCPALAKWCQ